jgi:TRAP-type mannitol/chloroaromatic compound transport system substrate-binding protein
MSWKQQDRYSNDLAAIRAAGVDVRVTPESVLRAQLAAWDKLIETLSADPFIAKVVESQKAWAKRVVGFYSENQVSGAMAYEHFFGS